MKKTITTLSIAFAMLMTLNAQKPVKLTGNVSNAIILDSKTIGKTFYFKTLGSGSYRQLWKTDGTPAGTQMLKDSFFSDLSDFSNINNTLYFIARSSPSSYEMALWKSNGTSAGTTVVKAFAGTGTNVTGFKVINNVGYFVLNVSSPGYIGLWKTDGTANGTVEVKSGIYTSSPFFEAGNQVVFFGPSQSNLYHRALYKTDGSLAGTVLLKDGVWDTQTGEGLGSSTNVNGTFYFYIAKQNALWKTDGTVSGSSKVATIGNNVIKLTSHNGSLYFVSSTGGSWELWKSDGTGAGTAAIPGLTYVRNLVSLGTSLYLDGKSLLDSEPYKSDGTAAGTVLLKDINAGQSSNPVNLTKVNSYVCFLADDGTNGNQVWKTDGTSTGTVMAYAAADKISVLSTLYLVPSNGHVIFVHNDELYAVLIDPTNGINDLMKSRNSINMFPNPSSGIFNIVWEGSQEASLQVFNMMGENIIQQTISGQLDLSMFAQGIYFVRIRDGNDVYMNKIVVE